MKYNLTVIQIVQKLCLGVLLLLIFFNDLLYQLLDFGIYQEDSFLLALAHCIYSLAVQFHTQYFFIDRIKTYV